MAGIEPATSKFQASQPALRSLFAFPKTSLTSLQKAWSHIQPLVLHRDGRILQGQLAVKAAQGLLELLDLLGQLSLVEVHDQVTLLGLVGLGYGQAALLSFGTAHID